MSLNEFINRCRETGKWIASPLSSATLNFVYPPDCILCGCEIFVGELAICELCQSLLKPRIVNECPRCGAPAGPYTDLEKGCGQCRREKFPFDRVIRLGVYDGDLRLACLRAKAAAGSGVAKELAKAVVMQKRDQFEECGIDLVVPVPEHWTRRILHPHYAAETLSSEISRQLKIRWSRSVLIKQRRTPKQATSPIVLRRQQQQGSFRVQKSAKLSQKTILLVDDVLTTGSTASAAARELKRAGAKRIIVAVIAVSPLRK